MITTSAWDNWKAILWNYSKMFVICSVTTILAGWDKNASFKSAFLIINPFVTIELQNIKRKISCNQYIQRLLCCVCYHPDIPLASPTITFPFIQAGWFQILLTLPFTKSSPIRSWNIQPMTINDIGNNNVLTVFHDALQDSKPAVHYSATKLHSYLDRCRMSAVCLSWSRLWKTQVSMRWFVMRLPRLWDP